MNEDRFIRVATKAPVSTQTLRNKHLQKRLSFEKLRLSERSVINSQDYLNPQSWEFILHKSLISPEQGSPEKLSSFLSFYNGNQTFRNYFPQCLRRFVETIAVRK